MMKGLRRLTRKAVSISLSAMLAVSMMPVPAYATITYDSGDNDYGEEVNESIIVNADDNDVTVTGGDIYVEETREYDALRVDISEGNTASVTTEDVVNEDGSGISVINYGGNSDLTVNGDVSATDIGVTVHTFEEGLSETTVNGDIESAYTGVWTSTGSESFSVFTVNGDISSEGYGVSTETRGKAASLLTVNGDIDAEVGIGAEAYSGGEGLIEVEGNVTASDDGIDISAANESYIGIKVNGDLTADCYGVYAYMDDDEAEVNIEVNGTISGSEMGVVVDGEGKDKVTVTAWKIIPDENGAVVGYVVEGEDYDEVVEDEDFEKNNISYIIRVEQPEQGATLTASQDTAHEGEKVTLRIDINDGLIITGAFSDEGKSIPLLQDAEGNYYVEVPRGGGVLLSVTLGSAPAPAPKSDEDDSSKSSESNTVPAVPAASVIPPASVAVTQESAVQAIATVEQGGTVSVVLTEGTDLGKMIVDSLAARPDVTLSVEFVYNGIRYRAVIPAGFDLTPFLNAAGGIDFETLIAHFASILQ